ncbi:MAG: Ig-like domain-containing protein [Limnohabitans sp.]
MAKTIKALVNTGKAGANTSFDVVQGSGDKGKPTRIGAVKGARYQLEDPETNGTAPQHIRSKRVGKSLHVMLDGSKEADLIIDGYYDESMLTESNRGLYGRAENGKLYEYIAEDQALGGMPINLADGALATGQVLGDVELGAAVGVVGLAPAFGFNALGAAFAAVAVSGVLAKSNDSGHHEIAAPSTAPVATDDSGAVKGIIANGGITKDTQPTFSGTGTPGNVIKIYDGTNVIGSATVGADGKYSITPSVPMGEGAHSISLTESNGSTESAKSPATAFTIDTTAPSAPAASAMTDDAGGIQGTIAADGTTDDTQPTFSGSGATPGDVIKIYDGSTVIGSGTVGADGKYSITPSVPLGEGAHSISSSATDPSGNESAKSPATAFTVDTTPPSAPAASAMTDDVGTPNGAIANNGTTDDTQPTFSGTGTPGNVIKIYDGSTVIGSGTVGADGKYSITPSTPLSEGAHSISSSATDPSGNESAKSPATTFTIDTTPPSAPAASAMTDDVGTPNGAIANNGTTDDTLPTFSGSGATPGDVIKIYDGSTVIGSGTVGADGKYSITPSVPLGEGAHSISSSATDPSGNESAKSPATAFTVDTTPPSAPAASAMTDDVGTPNGAIANNGTTDDTLPTFSGSGATPGDVIKIYDGSTVIGSGTVGADGKYSITPSTPLGEGAHSISTSATDPSGNESAKSPATAFTVDTTPPSAPVASAMTDDVGTPSGAIVPGSTTNDTQPTFSGSGATPGDVIKIYDGSTVIGSGTVGADGKYSITPSTPLGEGAHSISTSVTDPSGNESAKSDPLDFTVDTEPPAVPSTSTATDDVGTPNGAIVPGTTTDDTQPTFSGTGTPGDVIKIYDGSTVIGSGTVGADGKYSITPSTPFSSGPHSISTSATDTVGNESAKSDPLTFTVDNAPVNTVPSAQTASEDTQLAITGLSVNDVDGNLASTQLSVVHGTLNIDLTGGATVSAGANNSATLTLGGTQAQINAALATLNYSGVANYNGADTLTVLSTDTGGTFDSDTVAIDVTSVNDAPTAADATVTVLEDGSKTFAAADFGFSDADSNALSAVIITTLPTEGTLKLDGVAVTQDQSIAVADLGKLVFTPAANANGEGYATIGFKVQDDGDTANGGVDVSETENTLTIDVTAVNDAPTAADATVTVLEDGSKTFAAADFGFSDADSNSLSAVIITTLPTEGTLKLDGVAVTANQSIAAADLGKLVFTPAANANGAGYATIDFKVQDNGGTANSGVDTSTSANTLTIDVTAVNDAPTATSATVTVLEDSSKTFAAADFGFADDLDSNSLSAVIITTLPTEGTLKLDGVAVTQDQSIAVADLGKLVFTPAANANGEGYATIGFKVQDDGDTANGGVDVSETENTLTIDVTAVNDAPTATSATVTVLEDSSKTFAAADFGFADDLDSNALSAVIITTLPTAGTLKLDGVAVTANQSIAAADLGKLVFTPAANANGEGYATIDFKVQDNGGVDTSAAKTLTIAVTAVNDAPVNTVPSATQTLNEDGSKDITGLAIADVDAGSSDVTVTLAVAHGTLTVAAGTGVTLATNSTGSVTLTGTVSAINTLLATANAVTYAPTANYNGSDTLTMTTNDGGNAGSGGAASDTDTVAISVTAVNDAPVNTVPSATQTLNEDGSKDITGLAIADVDAGSSDVTVTLAVAHGTLTVAAGTGVTLATNSTGSVTLTGTVSAINTLLATANAVTYAPTANYNGSDTLTMTTNDGGNAGSGGAASDTDTVAISVTSVNDAPTATNSTVTILEDGSKTFAAADFGFSDADSNALSAVIITTLPAAGTLKLNGTAVTANQSIAAADLGKLVFTPAANANGAGYATIDFKVQDNGGTANGGVDTSAAKTLTIAVTAVNDAPVNTVPSATQTLNEDGSKDITGLAIADVDAGSSDVTVTLAVAHGTLTVAAGTGVTLATNSTGSVTLTGTVSAINTLLATANAVTYAPTANYNGSDTLTMTTNDGGNAGSGGAASDTDTVAISVSAVNDAPVNTVPSATQTLNEDGSKDITGLAIADVDAGSSDVTVTLAVAHGTLTVAAGTGVTLATNSTGSVTLTGTVSAINTLLATANAVTYAPTANYNGSDTLTMTTNDGGNAGSGGAASDTDTVAISVTSVNDAPTVANALPDTTGNVGTALSYTVASNAFTDLDNATLTYTATLADGSALPSWLSFNATTRTFSGTPTSADLGTLSIKVVASDGALSVNDSFDIAITSNSVTGPTTVSAVNLSAVAQGSGGFVINGAAVADFSGLSVDSAGDVNGDGFDDVIVGSFQSDDGATDAGQAYVVFGKSGGAVVELSKVATGVGGFGIRGSVAGGNASATVSALGDVNGDGLADLLVSADAVNAPAGTLAGRAYVVYGKTSGTAVNLSSVDSGNGGFVINGAAAADQMSIFTGLNSAGDVNGDGLADIAVGSIKSDPAGQTDAGAGYVVFGKTNSSAVNLADVVAGTGGFVMNGEAAGDQAGPISSAGDVNGDGLADVIVGARGAAGTAGRSYVVFGKTSGIGINLSAIAGGTGGFAINGESAGDNIGFTHNVSSAGDVNGDGLADVIVGSGSASGTAGRSYVVFGKTSGTAINLTTIAGGTGGFAITGQAAGDSAGTVSSAGDINGDGLADLIVGAPAAASNTGRSYVVFGKTSGTGIDLSAINAGVGGFAINGAMAGDVSGVSVSAAGDVNGDGFADLIVGAHSVDPAGRTNAGASYVVYGGTQFASGMTVVTGTGPVVGTAGNEMLVGSSSADTLTGGGGIDRFKAGAGDDTIVLTASDISNLANNTVATVKSTVDGGTGFDTIRLSGGASLDLTAISNASGMGVEEYSRIESIEHIDMSTDTGANTTTLRLKDVMDMSGMDVFKAGVAKHQLLISGDASDSVNINLAADWIDTTAVVTSNGHSYVVYEASNGAAAQLLIEQAIVNANHVS